jgi:hypothetical protein
VGELSFLTRRNDGATGKLALHVMRLPIITHPLLLSTICKRHVTMLTPMKENKKETEAVIAEIKQFDLTQGKHAR